MNPIVVVLLLVLIGLLGAQLTFSKRDVPLGPRTAIAIGLPFLFVGFALGPHLLKVLSNDIVERLDPMLALGLGWVGLLFGLQLDRGYLGQFPAKYLALAWLQAAVAFAVVFLFGYVIAGAWVTLRLEAVLLVAAATACVSTPAAIALISNTYRTQGPVTRLLFYMASLDAAVGIVALGVIQSAQGSGALWGREAMSPAEWFAFSVLLGLFFGMLFLSLTRIRPRTQELVLLLVGLVLFAAGTAFYLSLSPLFICMIAGVVIGNLSPMRRRVYTALSDWEQPIYIIMLVLAGALLEFSSWWIAPLVAGYVGLRILGKWLGGLLTSKLRPRSLQLPGTFGLALTPQGGISLAMAISFVLIYNPAGTESPTAISAFFATVVIAVGISDLIGPFMVRAVLQRAGEIGRRLASAGAAAVD